VAVAVVAVAGLAWLVVRAAMNGQLDQQITNDARTIATQPGQWRDVAPPVEPWPDRDGHGYRVPHDLGPRWQVVDQAGTPSTGPASAPALPVTARALRVAAGVAPLSMENVKIGGTTYRMVTAPTTGGGAVQVAASREPVDRTLGVLGVMMAFCCLAGIAGAALLGRTVARAGLAPVERLTGAVERVAATQDLQAAIPVTGEDEVARLARSVNAMLAALESSRAAQRMLVEDAGHELRTPLTSIRTNIELLVHAEAGGGSGRRLAAEDRARLLQDLQVQVVELTQLTSELVELAREDASPEPVQEVELVDVVTSAVERVRVRAPAVTVDASLEPAVVCGRPVALERTVLNLLDNAAKWSPPGGTVRVRLDTGPDPDPSGRRYATLAIADAGPGIDEQDRPRVFERFYRAAAARSMPGSGLGLAIVAQTVAQHGGAVQVGTSTDGGALLTVRLPLSPRDADTVD
jgi:two-component system sensor histidine kinase MprB